MTPAEKSMVISSWHRTGEGTERLVIIYSCFREKEVHTFFGCKSVGKTIVIAKNSTRLGSDEEVGRRVRKQIYPSHISLSKILTKEKTTIKSV